MKKTLVALGVVSLLVLAGCLEQGGSSSSTEPLFRYHFAGRSSVGKDGTATVLQQIGALKESAELRTQIAEKLATAGVELWKKHLPADAATKPALLQPLIEDLMSAEALVEVRGPVGRTETVVAVDLPESRARLWETNLWQLSAGWKLGTPTPVTLDAAKGWGLKWGQANLLQVFRVGTWTVVGLGQERLNMLAPVLQAAAAKNGRPVPALANHFLDLQADLPALKDWCPIFGRFPLPPVRLTMSGRGDSVRTEMRLRYSNRIPWKFEPWQIPTNLVSEPLTSFTVAQGIRPFLEKVVGLPELGLPLPNQYCAWGVFNPHVRAYFSVPQPGASNLFLQVAPKLPGFVKTYFPETTGEFLYFSNRSELVWGGVPFISPHLRAVSDGKTEYLQGGLFPLGPRQIPPPAELYAQFKGRTDLLYYDWELSSNRVNHARQMFQLASFARQRPEPSVTTPSQRWLQAIAPKLGNAVTEVTLSSPQELLLVRKSQVGLTGFEMATLSVWLDSPSFPRSITLGGPAVAAKTNAVPPKISPSSSPKK